MKASPAQLLLMQQQEIEFDSLPANVLGIYNTLLKYVRRLRCFGRVAGVCRRRPHSRARGWTNSECRRLLGIDRRQLPMLEGHKLVDFVGEMLVLPLYHRSPQWREEATAQHRREIGRLGGKRSGEARRGQKKAIATLGSMLDPGTVRSTIRASIVSVFEDLARSGALSALDSGSRAGAHRSRFEAKSGLDSEGSPDPGPLRKTAPSGAPSDLERMAPASVQQRRQLRLRGTRPVARTGRSTLSALASNRADPAVTEVGRQTGPEALNPLAIEFWDFYRKVSGNHHRQQQALRVYTDMNPSLREHRQLLRRARDFYARPPKKPGWRPAAAADFLLNECVGWLDRQRRQHDGGPATSADLVAAVLKKRGGIH
jgi:hypothetical protein